MNDPLAVATLLALALLCLAVRWTGFLAASVDRMPPKLTRFIQGVPAPLLAALVASSAVREGRGAEFAVVAAVLLMIVVRNEIIAVAAAVGLALFLT